MSEEKDKKPSSVAELIQNKFLEQRKIFLWGEVSDRSARDPTENYSFLNPMIPEKKLLSYKLSWWLYYSRYGYLRYHATYYISNCSSCYWNGCEYGFNFTLWSNKGKKVTLSSLQSLDSPAFNYRQNGCGSC